MFIGHIPAGYICGKILYKRFVTTGAHKKLFVLAAIAGGFAPDLDMFYFYLIDNRQTHHHMYWSHYPIVWLSLLIASSTWLSLARQKSMPALMLIFSIGGFVHLVLDTIVGDIWWLAPFAWEPFAFFTVPSLYKPWWLNFFLHWSFLLEIFVVTWAALLFYKTRRVG